MFRINVHNKTCTILLWINVTSTEIVPEKGRYRKLWASGWWVCWCLLQSPNGGFVLSQTACLKEKKKRLLTSARTDKTITYLSYLRQMCLPFCSRKKYFSPFPANLANQRFCSLLRWRTLIRALHLFASRLLCNPCLTAPVKHQPDHRHVLWSDWKWAVTFVAKWRLG